MLGERSLPGRVFTSAPGLPAEGALATRSHAASRATASCPRARRGVDPVGLRSADGRVDGCNRLARRAHQHRIELGAGAVVPCSGDLYKAGFGEKLAQLH